ncbi:RcnB family protein [Sphingobium nicotianae]|uniref:RcnB family protein n=1 Tax=Sphingobium nicotianae TaxID=2782607 RepID=A0A9X1IS60_9SPHN|nr:RcnB family protein [Sphingobium nicotianae]MBT2187830.1 RcnB family protein [Sphingobium nicotianae]
MKRLVLLTALLVLPELALAQGPQPAPGRDGPARPGPGHQGGQRPQSPRPPVTNPPPRPGTGGSQIQPPRPGPGGPQIQPARPSRPQPPRPQPPRPQPPRPVKPLPPHRPGAGRPPQFRPIHGPVFRYPHGYRYRRWVIGLILPRLFLSQSYFYDGYYDLGVGPPPVGYRWVRYGPDLLLVNVRTGRIADIIYGAFY